jgi:hypothetical protein
LLQLFEPRLLDRFDLLADELQPRHVAAQLGDEVRPCRSVCWVARESGGLKSLRRSDEGRCLQRRG